MLGPRLFISRFLRILPAILLAVLGAIPVSAGEPDFNQYPLRLEIFHTSAKLGTRTASAAGVDIAVNDPVFFGTGQGNLLYAGSAQAVDFTYGNCPNRVLSTARNQQFHARWKNEGTELEVLVPASKPAQPIHPNEDHFEKCVLQVALQDAVYVRQIGALTTISRQEYEKDLSLRASLVSDSTLTPQNQALPSVAVAAQSPFFGSKSITILPVPNAPFSATVVTEKRQLLPDGSTKTTSSHRFVARDRSGRVFEERRSLEPNGNNGQTNLLATEHSDPVLHLLYSCVPGSALCTAFPYNPPKTAATQIIGEAAVRAEDLGQKKIDDIETIGTRKITPLNTATNDDKELMVESWFSPQLKINLSEEYSGTPSGNHLEFSVVNLLLGEPAPMLFAPPVGYKIVLPMPLPQQSASR